MRLAFCCLATALAASAGVVQGVVIEHASGHPLARTRVRMEPVPKPGSGDLRPLQVRAASAGQFVFNNVPDGLYLLVTLRDGYFPAAYGQRRPNGRGTPIQVTRDSELFTQVPMWRLGAITGRVLDENGIGLTGVTVLAYRARLPLRSAGHGVSDDRGVYRVHGLEPGKYWVRTAAAILEDGSGRLPTFGPESREVSQARVHVVALDTDTTDADIRAEAGNLFRLNSGVQCSKLDGAPVNVVLSSETGRRSTHANCNSPFSLEGLAPGYYELFAVREDGTESGYIELFLDRDIDPGVVRLTALPTVEFEVRRPDNSEAANIAVALTGRRQDLAETEAEHAIEMPRTTLTAGHWEMHAHAGPGQYIESITNPRPPQRRRNRRPDQPSEFFDVFVEMFTQARIRITVSDKAAQIAGRVIVEGKGVPGVPVFLWPVSEASRRSLSGSLQVISDTDGQFRFQGLPPGDYRTLATFDLSEVDEEVLDAAKAPILRAEPSQSTKIDLPVWLAP